MSALGNVGASGPSLLLPPSSLLPAPSSLLFLPAKPYARPYARCKFDGSGLCWRSRPLPPPSSVLPSTTQNKPPMRAPMRGPRSSMDLDRAPCFETSSQNGTYAQAPMRGTRFSMDLDRAPCFEISPSKGNLCASPMRGPQFSMDLDRAPCSEASP